jgi:monofunctional biosynthetic peptidoglycan transglycosylase
MGAFRKRLLIFLGVLGGLAALVVGIWGYLRSQSSFSLPQGKLAFEKLRPPSSTPIFDQTGRVLSYQRPGPRHQLYRPASQISEHLKRFVVVSEDAKFFDHDGFDFDEIKNSVEANIEKGRVKRGASTITQQLAKNLFLSKERSIERKLFEIPWTMRIELDLSKSQILDLYLNVIEWGPGVYGAEAASRHFFDTTAANLTVGQALYLAMIVPNPVRFDLFANPRMREFIEQKRKAFVDRLVDEKKLNAETAAFYRSDPFALIEPDHAERKYAAIHLGPYFGGDSKIDQARKDLVKESIKRRASRCTLDLLWQTRLEKDSPAKGDGNAANIWVSLVKDDIVIALRKTAPGKALSAEFQNTLSDEGIEATYSAKAPWSEIFLSR